MNRIDKKFKELKRVKRKAFIAYITAGDPNLSMTKRIALVLEESGADIIELGIPFSDPLADGPTIQAASERALQNKTTLRKIFKMALRLRSRTDIPMVFMTYYNLILKYGLHNFFKSCRRIGVDGVIVPDLPCEEAKELVRKGRACKVSTIFLIAPTSTRERMKSIAKNSKGFIYYVSLTGVTGARERLGPEIMSNVKSIKSITRMPVAVGFGVSTARQAKDIARFSDGVIVGSAIVKIIESNSNDRKMLLKISNFAKRLARAIHGA